MGCLPCGERRRVERRVSPLEGRSRADRREVILWRGVFPCPTPAASQMPLQHPTRGPLSRPSSPTEMAAFQSAHGLFDIPLVLPSNRRERLGNRRRQCLERGPVEPRDTRSTRPRLDIVVLSCSHSDETKPLLSNQHSVHPCVSSFASKEEQGGCNPARRVGSQPPRPHPLLPAHRSSWRVPCWSGLVASPFWPVKKGLLRVGEDE
mgnify:CR=1 FL=1